MSEVLRRYVEERRSILLLILAGLVLNLLLYVAVTTPARLRRNSLRAGLVAARDQTREALRAYGRAALEARLMRLAEGRIDELYRDTFRKGNERFPTVDEKIKELTGKFRLEPRTTSYDYQVLGKERLERLNVSFNLKGGYDSLRSFVEEIEQARDADGNDLFFAIDQISLADSTAQGAELNLTIAVTTYFHKPELAALEDSRGAGRRR